MCLIISYVYRMLNKLDVKNYDKVVGAFNFEELVREEPASEIAHIVFNKVRYLC